MSSSLCWMVSMRVISSWWPDRERLKAARAALLGEDQPAAQITWQDVAAYLAERPRFARNRHQPGARTRRAKDWRPAKPAVRPTVPAYGHESAARSSGW
jgi:hypothetical protein